jgi:hypothetical protein
MFKIIYRKLPKLLFLYAIFFPVKSLAFDLLINGFGTVCASKSDLAKYAIAEIPMYPFPTLLRPLNTGTAPYVADVTYVPSYLGAGRRWSFLGNSKFGLQFTSIFDERFKAVVQMVGRAENLNNNHFTVQMDWAYLQYNATNDLDFQFGRFRLPAFYYSDYLDVNHAQPWVRPPEEVYYIVGNAFRNMDGIKARYAYYVGDWTMNSKLWFGSMEDQLTILAQPIYVSVNDVIGGSLQIENDRFSVQGSLMRAIYNTNLNDSLAGLVTTTELLTGGPFPAAQNLLANLQDTDEPIIYLGLAFTANITDNLDLLMERASILSDGIVSTAREGWYASLTYSFLEQYALTFTYGFSRPLQTEINKYNALAGFFNSPQYLNNVDHGSGAGEAATNLFQAYLCEQRSLAVDGRYDILPSLSLKGSVKYVTPVGQTDMLNKYIFNLQRTGKHIWVYRVSFDFVF